MRRRWLRALVFSYGMLGLAVSLAITLVDPRTDLGFVLPKNPTPDVELVAERLQRGPSAGQILLAISGATPENLIGLSNRLATAFIDSGRFRYVANGRTGPFGPELEVLFKKRYLMNPPLDESSFEVGTLRQALDAWLDFLRTSEGAASKRLLPADPTRRLRDIMTSWAGTSRATRRGGLWLSGDKSMALMMVQTSAPGFGEASQQETLKFMRRTFDALKDGPDLRMELTGPSVFASKSSELIRWEMRILSAASALLVIIVLYTAFQSLPMLFAMLLPLGFGLCAGIAAVQFLFGQIHGITLAFGGMLIGVAVDYPIHMISHRAMYNGKSTTIDTIWPTIRLGMLTTVAAFIPMTLSSFPGLSQLGVFAIAGLMTAGLITRWLLPSVLPPVPNSQTSAIWNRLQPKTRRNRWLRWGSLAIAMASCFYLIARGATIWETDLRNLSTTPAAARDLDRRLRAEIAAADVRYLLVLRKPSMEAVLRSSEALQGQLQRLVESGEITGFDMASRYLPSLHRQERQRQYLPERTVLRAAIEQASIGLPFHAGLFEPFLDGVEQSKHGYPLTRDDFASAGLAWLLDALLLQQGGGWVGLIVPRGVTNPQALRAFVAQHPDEPISFLDLKSESEKLVAGYRQEALIWLILGTAVAMAILLMGLRSLVRAARVLAPVVLSILVTVSILMATGTQLSLFHLFSFLVTAGVGLDYALFFERFTSDMKERPLIVRSNILCAATSTSVFTVLAFSQIPVLHAIGLTVAVGTMVSLIFTFIIASRSVEPAS